MGLIKTVTTTATKAGEDKTPGKSTTTADKKSTPSTAREEKKKEDEKKAPAAKETKSTIVNKSAKPSFDPPANKAGAKKGSDEADPIEDSLNQRIKAGGVTQVVPADKKGATAVSKIAAPSGNATSKTSTTAANKS